MPQHRGRDMVDAEGLADVDGGEVDADVPAGALVRSAVGIALFKHAQHGLLRLAAPVKEEIEITSDGLGFDDEDMGFDFGDADDEDPME